MALRRATFSLLGTGNSTGVPWLQCVMNTAQRCTVCQNCLDDPTSKNKRNNVSAMVTVHDAKGPSHVLIDCGKTFRESAIHRFQQFKVKKLAAVILTHPHADAILGLDDLRDCSPHDRLPVYLNLDTFEVVKRSFPYLMMGPNQKPSTFIAKLDWHIIREWEPFVVGDTGLVCTPLPVLHGSCACFGYEFRLVTSAAGTNTGESGQAAKAEEDAAVQGSAGTGSKLEPSLSEGERLVYLSDIHSLPADTRAYLTNRAIGPVHHMVLDALSYRRYPTHFSFKQALAMTMDIAYGEPGPSRQSGPVSSVRPAQVDANRGSPRVPPHVHNTVLVGMNHRIDYYKENAKLKEFGAAHGLSIELGYDGWSVDSRLAECSSVETARDHVRLGIGAEQAHMWHDIHAQEKAITQTYSPAATLASMSSQSVESLPLSLSVETPWLPPASTGVPVLSARGLSDSFTLDTAAAGPPLCGDVGTVFSDSPPGLCGESCAHGAQEGATKVDQGVFTTVPAHVAAIKAVLERGAIPYDDAIIPEYDEGNTVTPPLPSQSI